MPDAPTELNDQIDWLSNKILFAELWLAENLEDLESKGTATAGVKIAIANSKIHTFKRIRCSLQAERARGEEKTGLAKQFEQLALDQDRHAKEWEQQRSRMVNQIKTDLFPKLKAEIERWKKAEDVLDELEEDPETGDFPSHE